MSWLSTLGHVVEGLVGITPKGSTPTTTNTTGNIISGLVSGIGSGLGAVSQASAQNRGAKLSAMMAQDNSQLQEQAQRNADIPNIMNQLRAANYVAAGGNPNFGKPITTASGHVFTPTPYLEPITDADKQAAQSEITQLTNRLNTPPTYNNYSSVMNPSGTETATGWLGALFGGLNNAKQTTQNQNYLDALLKQLNPQSTSTTSEPDLSSGNYQ